MIDTLRPILMVRSRAKRGVSNREATDSHSRASSFETRGFAFSYAGLLRMRVRRPSGQRRKNETRRGCAGRAGIQNSDAGLLQLICWTSKMVSSREAHARPKLAPIKERNATGASLGNGNEIRKEKSHGTTSSRAENQTLVSDSGKSLV